MLKTSVTPLVWDILSLALVSQERDGCSVEAVLTG